jgi:hypothetical protein
MDTFIVVRCNYKDISESGEGLYHRYYSDCIIYNFDTEKYKIFTKCHLFVNNDKNVFLFEMNICENSDKIPEQVFNIITTYDVDNCIEIKYKKLSNGYWDNTRFRCICNSNILVYCVPVEERARTGTIRETNYYDIKNKKIIYKSKYEFVEWVDNNKIVEIDTILGKCNLVSFISEDTVLSKEPEPHIVYENCTRCLDKYIILSTSNTSKNICDMCADSMS